MRAYSYIRFSTPKQEHGDSLRRQLEATREYCREHRLELDEDLTFRDLGVSAFKGDNIHNGRLGAFLKAIDDGKVAKGSCLIVENLDRLSRGQIDDAGELFRKILRKGIDIVTLTDGKRFTKESLNNPTDLMLSIMYFYRAYDESLQKGKRVRAAWKNKRKQADEKPLTATCPSWLKLNKERKRFEVLAEKAEIVRRTFNLSLNGMGNGSIAKLFNKEGVPGIGRVNSWHASVVARILTSRAVLGEFQPCTYVDRRKRVPDGEPVPDYFPRIISDDLFNKVQFRQKRRRVAGSGRRGKVLRNLFSHVAKCGYCGASMIYTQKRSDSLVCNNASRGVKCRYVGYPYPEFERSFLTFVSELDLSSVLTSSDNGTRLLDEEIEQCRAAIAEIESKLEKLAEAVATTSSSPATLVRKIQELECTKSAKEKHLSDLCARRQDSLLTQRKCDNLKALLRKARRLDGEKANETRLAIREAIRSLVERIQVFPYVPTDSADDLSKQELRDLKRQGWKDGSDLQRMFRHFRVFFHGAHGYRHVASNPKLDPHGSLRLSKLYRPLTQPGRP